MKIKKYIIQKMINEALKKNKITADSLIDEAKQSLTDESQKSGIESMREKIKNKISSFVEILTSENLVRNDSNSAILSDNANKFISNLSSLVYYDIKKLEVDSKEKKYFFLLGSFLACKIGINKIEKYPSLYKSNHLSQLESAIKNLEKETKLQKDIEQKEQKPSATMTTTTKVSSDAKDEPVKEARSRRLFLEVAAANEGKKIIEKDFENIFNELLEEKSPQDSSKKKSHFKELMSVLTSNNAFKANSDLSNIKGKFPNVMYDGGLGQSKLSLFNNKQTHYIVRLLAFLKVLNYDSDIIKSHLTRDLSNWNKEDSIKTVKDYLDIILFKLSTSSPQNVSSDSKDEPVKSEPVKSEPVKSEPVKDETVKESKYINENRIRAIIRHELIKSSRKR